MAGRVPFPYTEVDAATKDGLIGFTRGLRSDYHARGVSASVLILGAIRDVGQGQRMLDESGMKASGFFAPAESVARAVVKAVKKDRAELVVMPGPGPPDAGPHGLLPRAGTSGEPGHWGKHHHAEDHPAAGGEGRRRGLTIMPVLVPVRYPTHPEPSPRRLRVSQ
jgi:hypothetical protein